MGQLTLSLLYKYVILSLIILQNATGIEETNYFLQRKKMLANMKITLHPQPKDSKIEKYYYSHNLTSRHNYNITINEPDLCSKYDQVFLLILIRTHYAHFKWREIERELLNHKSSMPHRKGILVKYLFIFGKSDDQRIESLVRDESKRYRDILQENFTESYFNIIKKVITAWKWTVNFCPNAEYVMIINDELLLDVDKIVEFLLQDYSVGHFDDHFALCFPRIREIPTFLKLARYRTMPRESLYKGKFFPRYCLGWGYAAHVTVINKLYKASFTNPPFMPTDAFIGVLAEKLRLGVLNHKERYVIYNVANYFADPLYLTRKGMIAVTDHASKYHELNVMKSVLNSMRRHWKKTGISTISLPTTSNAFFSSVNVYYGFYVAITMLTFCCISIFSIMIYTRVLKLYCFRCLISKRNT